MSWLKKTLTSSIGLKAIMAVTGLLLVLFVLQHLCGNLLVYAGKNAFNSYAYSIKSLGALLWIARIGLLITFLLHVATGIKLAIANKKARPINYSYKNKIQLTLASRTMIESGSLLLAFIIYHLAHFTFHGIGDIGHYVDELGRHDAYKMFVLGFQDPLASIIYIIAMILLGLHISHGISSLFQSLGVNNPKYFPALKKAGLLIGWAVAWGNISMPVAVLLGIIRLEG